MHNAHNTHTWTWSCWIYVCIFLFPTAGKMNKKEKSIFWSLWFQLYFVYQYVVVDQFVWFNKNKKKIKKMSAKSSLATLQSGLHQEIMLCRWKEEEEIENSIGQTIATHYLWISRLPAFMQIVCKITIISTRRIQAQTDHVQDNVMDFLVFAERLVHRHQIDFGIFFHMHFVEQTIHVALQFLIFEYRSIAELLNRICRIRWQENIIYSLQLNGIALVCPCTHLLKLQF